VPAAFCCEVNRERIADARALPRGAPPVESDGPELVELPRAEVFQLPDGAA
jgi:hypothetical protein